MCLCKTFSNPTTALILLLSWYITIIIFFLKLLFIVLKITFTFEAAQPYDYYENIFENNLFTCVLSFRWCHKKQVIQKKQQ